MAVPPCSRYKQNAQRVARNLAARKMQPVKECADWIEYVHATEGAQHLQLPSASMPFFAVYNLDVVALLLAVVLGLGLLLVGLVRCLCCRSRNAIDPLKKNK
eukprot:m.207442 g.207442  ORF g.207442 m.207442 type:complete len:102 (-) comp22055_c0_seq4:136-441(-)